MDTVKTPSCTDALPRTIWWEPTGEGVGNACLIDQRKLPVVREDIRCTGHMQMVDAIKTLAVRGAPAIGVSGAFAMALWACNESTDETVEAFLASMDAVAAVVAEARPTAVNLSWGVRQVTDFARAHAGSPLPELKRLIVERAVEMADDDERTNRLIGMHGASVLKPGSRIMTHCNAGALATVVFGTALGVIFTAFDRGLVEHVYPCETRPVNQGGRLTAWELMQAGIPSTLICDNMAATVMSQGKIDAVIVGADRIAANGDTANKIGTMGHAVLARHFGIPFYIAAPFSTIDFSIASGADIVIEQRKPEEIRGISVAGRFAADDAATGEALERLGAAGGEVAFDGPHRMRVLHDDGGWSFTGWFQNTPVGVDVFNPAFDVTPAELITGIITERGVFKPGELPQGV